MPQAPAPVASMGQMFYPYGPSQPFFMQPQVVPVIALPKYICKKREDGKGEEELVCEVDPESVPPQRQLYTYPLGGRWFF